MKYFFAPQAASWELLVNNIKMFCGRNMYFIHDELLRCRFYGKAVTTDMGNLDLRFLGDTCPAQLFIELSSELLSKLLPIKSSKTEMYKHLIGSASVPPKHLIF